MNHREYREHVKDLSCISKDFCRIVIVDNNPFSFLLQPVNGIPCIPFSAGQPHDEQVPMMLCHYFLVNFYQKKYVTYQDILWSDILPCAMTRGLSALLLFVDGIQIQNEFNLDSTSTIINHTSK